MNDVQTLLEKIEELQIRLEEAEETLNAIRTGEVDALVVSGVNGHQIFTLQNAERPYRVLIEAMQEGAVTLSDSGLILYSNQRFADMLKTPLEKVLGGFIQTFLAPQDREKFLTLLGKDNRAEISLLSADGAIIPTSVAVGVISEDAVCLVVTDLTVQKQREQEIILLQRLQRAVSEAKSLEDALHVVLYQVGQTTGWAYGEAWIHSLDTLTCVSTWQSDASEVNTFTEMNRGLTILPGNGVIGGVWQHKEAIWLPDIQRESLLNRADTVVQLGLKSVFATPILAGDNIVAVIAFFASGLHMMDEHFIRLVSTVAAQLGSFIQRKQIEEALVKARQELESRVIERTAELTRTNKTLQAEVAERVRIADRITGLHTVITALSAALTPKHVAQVMVERGLAIINAVAGSVYLQSDQNLKLLASKNYMHHDENVMRQCIGKREVRWIFDEDDCEVIIPLILQEAVVGVLTLKLPVNDVNADDRRFILTLAKECAQTLERARLYEAEAKARQEAEAANKTKLRFLAMISHELRTPLTSIKGFASTLLADDVDWDAPAQQNFIQIIDHEADKLKDLIEQLLDLSQLHAGMLKITPDLFTLPEILEQAQTHLESVTRTHQFEMSVSRDLSPVFVDKTRVIQVIYNLVENSAKYSPPNTHIKLQAYQENGQIRCDVIDEGVGIPPQYRESVFEAFQQLADSKKGIGLGLAICKGLIEAHGGHIWIEDQPRPGTMISFTLPFVK